MPVFVPTLTNQEDRTEQVGASSSGADNAKRKTIFIRRVLPDPIPCNFPFPLRCQAGTRACQTRVTNSFSRLLHLRMAGCAT